VRLAYSADLGHAVVDPEVRVAMAHAAERLLGKEDRRDERPLFPRLIRHWLALGFISSRAFPAR
jgi:hypothetical protein